MSGRSVMPQVSLATVLLRTSTILASWQPSRCAACMSRWLPGEWPGRSLSIAHVAPGDAAGDMRVEHAAGFCWRHRLCSGLHRTCASMATHSSYGPGASASHCWGACCFQTSIRGPKFEEQSLLIQCRASRRPVHFWPLMAISSVSKIRVAPPANRQKLHHLACAALQMRNAVSGNWRTCQASRCTQHTRDRGAGTPVAIAQAGRNLQLSLLADAACRLEQ